MSAIATHFRELLDEREATQASSDQKIEKVEEEAPKEELPSPAEPEVALPKPTPVEEKPKEEVKEETSPQVRVAQEPTAESKAAAPRQIDAQLSTKSAAPDAGTAASTARSIVSWQNSVMLQINRHKRYPAAARSQEMQGVVQVSISIDRGGRLMSSQVSRSSGFAPLDEEALEILKRASPLPPLQYPLAWREPPPYRKIWFLLLPVSDFAFRALLLSYDEPLP